MKRLLEVEHWGIREYVSRAVGCAAYPRRYLECWSTYIAAENLTRIKICAASEKLGHQGLQPSDLWEDLVGS